MVPVHVESVRRAVLSRLNHRHEIPERGAAPCDRIMPLDGTYRIDGSKIRSSWVLHLEAPASPGAASS